MCFVDPLLAKTDLITDHHPKWVLLTHESDEMNVLIKSPTTGVARHFFEPGYDYVEANYDRVARTDTTICDIELWRRKDVTDFND